MFEQVFSIDAAQPADQGSYLLKKIFAPDDARGQLEMAVCRETGTLAIFFQ